MLRFRSTDKFDERARFEQFSNLTPKSAIANLATVRTSHVILLLGPPFAALRACSLLAKRADCSLDFGVVRWLRSHSRASHWPRNSSSNSFRRESL
jgi:hypothetical protein